MIKGRYDHEPAGETLVHRSQGRPLRQEAEPPLPGRVSSGANLQAMTVQGAVQLQRAIGNRAFSALLKDPVAENQAHLPAAEGLPLQREVKEVWGKWKSTLDMSKVFTSKQEAEAWEKTQPKPVPAPQQAQAATYVWQIRPSARNHYGDGWGRAYNIRSDAELKQAIIEGGTEDEGNDEVLLGNFSVGAVKGKGCNILYRNTWAGNTCTTDVWHCGPTLAAG